MALKLSNTLFRYKVCVFPAF